ncbi:MAG: ATP-binding domain-containing protein, partial [Allobranchiibius sp.]
KGLEYDATVIVDPDEISRESPGGVRVLYVALTRAAHRMTIIETSPGPGEEIRDERSTT